MRGIWKLLFYISLERDSKQGAKNAMLLTVAHQVWQWPSWKHTLPEAYWRRFSWCLMAIRLITKNSESLKWKWALCLFIKELFWSSRLKLMTDVFLEKKYELCRNKHLLFLSPASWVYTLFFFFNPHKRLSLFLLTNWKYGCKWLIWIPDSFSGTKLVFSDSDCLYIAVSVGGVDYPSFTP